MTAFLLVQLLSARKGIAFFLCRTKIRRTAGLCEP